jgi:hypothetical protein
VPMIEDHEMLMDVNALAFLRVAGDAADRLTIRGGGALLTLRAVGGATSAREAHGGGKEQAECGGHLNARSRHQTLLSASRASNMSQSCRNANAMNAMNAAKERSVNEDEI